MQPSAAKVATEAERGEAAPTTVIRVRTPETTWNNELAYSSMEEYHATNVTERSESYERGPEHCSGTKFSSNLVGPTEIVT